MLAGIAVIVLIGVGLGIELLAEIASFMFLITYALVHVAVIQLRRTDDTYDPDFAVPSVLYPAIPVLGLLATVAIMTQMGLLVIVGGVALPIAGAGWYALYVPGRSDPAPAS